MSFTIPEEQSREFAHPDLSGDLLGVLNFYFTHREAGGGILPPLASTGESFFSRMKTKTRSL